MFAFLMLLCSWVASYGTSFGLARFGRTAYWEIASTQGQIIFVTEPHIAHPARGMMIDVRHNSLSYNNGPKDVDLNIMWFTLARLKTSRGSGDVIFSAYTLVGIPYWFIEGFLALLLFKRIRLLGRTRQSGFEVSMPNRDAKTLPP